MALDLRLGADDLVRCRFAVSPLCQTHEALRTLRRPRRHGHHRRWLRRVRDTLTTLDLSSLWLFFPPPGGYTPDFLGPPPQTPLPAFDDELARMRATDPAVAREEMFRSLRCTPGAADTPRARALLDDPAAAVRHLADLTERAWHALVAPDWPRLRSVLEADIAHRSRQLAHGGLEALLAGLDPRIGWDPSTLTVRVRGVFPGTRRLDGRGVLLMPSTFVWPDVVSGFAPPWQPTVIYPARGVGGLWQPPARRATDPLAQLLGRNRAEILTGLDRPACTTELADRHGLAPSSVSAHLRVLRDSGLLTSRRHGHQVLYERTAAGDGLAGHG